MQLTRAERDAILCAFRAAQNIVKAVYTVARARQTGPVENDPALQQLYATRDQLIEMEDPIVRMAEGRVVH
jgi:hypothetical protein